jgi:hypothetical protein
MFLTNANAFSDAGDRRAALLIGAGPTADRLEGSEADRWSMMTAFHRPVVIDAPALERGLSLIWVPLAGPRRNVRDKEKGDRPRTGSGRVLEHNRSWRKRGFAV